MTVLRYDLNPKDVDAVIALLRRTQIEGVMVFTGGSDQYARPQTLAEADRWLEQMVPVADRFRDADVEFEVNVWCTLGHGGVSWVGSRGFQCQVGHSGEILDDVVCPLDDRWREEVALLYARYAILRPRTIWIDDDFRYHNHAPAAWTCFCPLHMERFSQATGRDVMPTQLWDDLAQGDAELERIWAGILNESLITLAQGIARAVGQVSVDTKMGLMTSNPEVHGREGRDWRGLLAALSLRHPAEVRPTLGNYSGGDAVALIEGTFLARRTEALVAPHRVRTEVESYPYGPWNKSNRFLRLQMLASLVYGMDDMTLNLFPYGGRLPESYDGLETVLQEVQQTLCDVKSFLGPERTYPGVGMPIGKEPRRHVYPGLYGHGDERIFEVGLALLGIPVSYAKGQSVNVLSTYVISQLSDEELLPYFQRGVILDAEAASLMTRRGLNPWVKVRVGAVLEQLGQEELAECPDLMLRDLRIDRVRLRELWPEAGAKMKTILSGPGGIGRGPGMVWAENSLGGRVAVVADDGAAGGTRHATWQNRPWQILWRNTVTWLARGRIPAMLENAPNCVAIPIEGQEGRVLAVLNVGLDPLNRVTWILERSPSTVFRRHGGQWREVPMHSSDLRESVSVTLDSPVSALEVAWFWIPRS